MGLYGKKNPCGKYRCFNEKTGRCQDCQDYVERVMSGPASGVVTTTPARTTPQMGDLTSAVGELGLPGVILSSALFVAGVAGTVGGIMFLIKEKKLPFFKGKRTAKRKGQKRRK